MEWANRDTRIVAEYIDIEDRELQSRHIPGQTGPWLNIAEETVDTCGTTIDLEAV